MTNRRLSGVLRRPWWAGLCLAGLAIAAGCHRDPYERVIVSGSVRYAGEPLQAGMIRFLPKDDTQTPPNGGYIREGRYRIATRGGVAVGDYRVIIEAYRPAADSAQPVDPLTGHSGRAGGQFLPQKYNEQSELTLTIGSGAGEMVKDFDLDP